jgi:CBS domain-containing protein
MKIKDIMKKKVVTVLEDSSVQEIAKLLHRNKIRHVYVINSKKEIKGVVGVTEIGEKVMAEGKSSKDVLAKEIMVPKVVSVKESDGIKKAYLKIIETKTSSLPVVKDKKIVGVVSLVDCVNILLKEKNGKKTH